MLPATYTDEPTTTTLFEQLITCRWTAKGQATVLIPVSRITETVDTRLAARRRAYRLGWKLDSTSRDGHIWELECIYRSAPTDEDDDGEGIYPYDLNDLCATIDVDATGDLDLPTRGPVRARFKGYRRTEDAEMVDAATIALTFWEDNEDDATSASFSGPTAKAGAKLAGAQATEDLAEAGAWDFDIGDFNELCAGLEAIANFPGDIIDQVDAKVNAIVNGIARVEKAFADSKNRLAGDASTLLTDPSSAPALRSLSRLGDVATKARLEAGLSTKTVLRRFDRTLSIFDVATTLGQDGTLLLGLNRGLPDPLAIPPGTPVRVYA